MFFGRQSNLVYKIHPTRAFSQGIIKDMPVNPLSDIGAAYASCKDALVYERCEAGIPTAAFVNSRQKLGTLGLSTLSNLRKESSPRGQKGMTSYQRHQVRDGAALLERRYGRKNLSFFTATLPPTKGPVTNEQWTRIIKHWRDAMAYHMKAVNLPVYIVGVFEFQMKRYHRRGDLCLHLHALFPGKLPNGAWAFTPKMLQEVWNRCVVNVLGGCADDYYLGATCNVQRVKHSAVAYLGKYMTKSGTEIATLISAGHAEQLPSTWVCISMRMKRWIASSIVYLSGAIASLVYDVLSQCESKAFQYKRTIRVELPDGHILTVGSCGTLTPYGLSLVNSCR